MPKSPGRHWSWARELRAATLLVFCLALSTRAHADEDNPVDVATAREVGYQALLALERQEYAIAETGLSRALSLRPAPTFYEARGRSRLALGKWLAAAQDFSAAIAFRERQHESEAFQLARANAKAALARLEAQLPHLTLSPLAPVARVTVDGLAWSSAALGVPRPLDPGAHTIDVFAASGSPRRYTVDLKPAERRTLAIEPAPLPLSAASAVPTEPKPQLAARTLDAPGPTSAPNRTAAYVLGATSIALIASAVVTGVVALDRRSAFDDENQPQVPLARKQSLRRDATTWAWLNTGLWTAAIAASGLTAYLFVTGMPSQADGRVGLDLQLTAAGQF